MNKNGYETVSPQRKFQHKWISFDFFPSIKISQ